ncbi:GlxA family transcriptional regulator [Maridesulfovibrio sp. FT414]|uniref:GlxA family transcriptional regulator n=1 Tax=Maridesulfovibrio sp. FT414 TaxID=2979469 RepID=UPI003D805498
MFFVIAANDAVPYSGRMKKQLEIFLFDGVVSLDVSGPLEVFNTATELLQQGGRSKQGYSPVFSAVTPGPVRTSSGLVFHAETFSGKTSADILLVPGGMIAEKVSADPEVLSCVRAAASRARRIVSVCSGAFILAACGLLGGRRVTTHWMVSERLSRLYPDVNVEPDAIYIRDGNISTSGGVTAGIDLALAIVEDDFGPSLALEVARVLLLYRRRPGSQAQFSSSLAIQAGAGRFSGLVGWMEANLDRKLTVEQLAEHANMSPRSFARIFPSETGMSPGRFVEQLRIDRARELIESGVEPFDRVAQESGFGREERLRRAFLRRLGVSPAQYRAHFLKGENNEKESDLRNIHI